MRVFIAVPLPAAVAGALEHDVVTPLRGLLGGARWTPSRARHLTLRFLGECDEPRVTAVGRAVAAAVGPHAPFEAAFGTLGTFPPSGRARVLWAGLTAGAEPAARLAVDVEHALAAIGIDPETRPFRPHVTLARLTPPRRVVLPADVRPVPTTFVVREVVVFRSVLLPGGARHDPLLRVALQGDRV